MSQNLKVETEISNFSTATPPPNGWDGRAHQGSIIPPDFSPPQSLPESFNYSSLPVADNYPEPVAESNKVR